MVQLPKKYAKYTITGQTKCFNCNENTLCELHKGTFLGGDLNLLYCPNCGLTLLPKSKERFTLNDLDDIRNPLWTSYKFKKFTLPEWEKIGHEVSPFNDKLNMEINNRFKDFLTRNFVRGMVARGEITISNYEECFTKLETDMKNELLEIGELMIYVPHMTEETITTMDMRPKGITDVIGGAYGQTSIRKTADIKTLSSPTTKWVEDKLLLNDDGFTILSTGETILFDHIASINVNEKTPSDMGIIVSVTLENSYNFAFRAPITLSFETLVKEKITNRMNSQEQSTNNVENSSSDADELMKYAELYEKGLITEEEFTAFKKKLLGL